jgi:hypothetical protein
MSALTPTLFRARYPEFTAEVYPDLTVASAISDAESETNSTQWGALYSRGAYALTAHLLTVNGPGASPIGGVKSRSIGDVSVTFSEGASALDELGSTRYGAEYVRLRNLISGGAVIV